MTTLEDKILGEKAQNYCSSSEDEGPELDPGEENKADASTDSRLSCGVSNGTQKPGSYNSQNTGPKGVIKDWEEFQRHEISRRDEEKKKLLESIKKSAIQVPSVLDEDIEQDLMSDEILQEFVQKRMANMLKNVEPSSSFEGVKELKSADEFLKTIDEASKALSVVIHIYNPAMVECVRMNECLDQVACDYKKIQFCRIKSSLVGVSASFKLKGVPAILVYRDGNLIGNFVQLKEEFGTDFYPGDVENFLIETGMLQERTSLN